MGFKIPKRFKLLGKTIEVKFDPTYFVENVDAVGFASFRLGEIQIRPSSKPYPINKEETEHIFFHELMHFILYHAGSAYDKEQEYMHQDENFVDLVAGLLHQALSTAEYK